MTFLYNFVLIRVVGLLQAQDMQVVNFFCVHNKTW